MYFFQPAYTDRRNVELRATHMTKLLMLHQGLFIRTQDRKLCAIIIFDTYISYWTLDVHLKPYGLLSMVQCKLNTMLS